jgi:RHS repeat-associated protein
LAYDAANRLTNMVDAVGTNALAWTPWGALASEDGPWDQDTVTCGQNEALLRQALSLVQPNRGPWTQSYTYDDQWRLTNLTSGAGTFAYAWDGAQTTLPAQVDLPNSAFITNTFDDLGRLTSTVLKNSGGTTLNSHAYVYDAANERTRQTLKDGNYWDYGYDPLGQLTSAKGKESGGTSRLQEQLTYGYDAAGNLLGRTNNNLQQTFTLSNVLNQLSTVTRNTNLTVVGMTTPAATSVTLNGAGATLYADKTFAKEVTSVSAGTNTFTAIASDGSRTDTNAVTVSLPGSVTFQYDGNGNLTSDGRRAFDYDDANQLTAVQVTNAWRSEFKYDGLGRRRVRTEKVWQSSAWVTASETRYVYDHMLVLQERDANNLPTVTYTRGIDLGGGLQRAGGIGGLLARTDFQGTVFYHADAGGNITALIDGYQNLVARYRYDPFGNLLGLSGSMADANLYRFSSKEWHGNSGLYYYGFRFYEPSLQRWLNRDPLGDSHRRRHRGVASNADGASCLRPNDPSAFNVYNFVGNQPPGAFDPMGLFTVAYGFQGSFGGALECNAGLQFSLSCNGWNPLDWRIGTQSTVCPFTSVMVGGGGAAGFLFSYSNAQCPEEWSDETGFGGASVTLPPYGAGPVVIGFDVGNISLEDPSTGHWKYDFFIGEGLKGSPFGPFERHGGVSWTEAVSNSFRDILESGKGAFADLFYDWFYR